jgi:DNA recombination protein RmuC
MTTIPIIWSACALFLGVMFSWLLKERELAGLRASLVAEKTRSCELGEQLARADAAENDLTAALAAANERAAGVRQLEEQMRGEFAVMAQGALEGASSRFLDLASVRIAPLQDEFAKFTSAVSALQTTSAQDLGALKKSLQDVTQLQTSLQDAVRSTNDATGQLRSALQNPRAAGNWGELSLDRIVELAGMSDHVDFERQAGMSSNDGSNERPDMTIHLTGGLCIPVDAKASTANYIRAVGAPEGEERSRLLKQSVSDLRACVSDLRARAYDKIKGYAGMTILYVPNESMLSSALAQDPALIEDALRDQIVICSPLLLLCYLRAFAHGWRLQKQQENVVEVARRGRMLHERLQSFFGALDKVGLCLNLTVDKFNAAVGKMDRLVVPGRELGKLLGLSGELEGVEPVDSLARHVPLKHGGQNGTASLP